MSAQPTPMPVEQIGVGSRGFDFLIGSWHCAGTQTNQTGPLTFSMKFDKASSAEGLAFVTHQEGPSGLVGFSFDPYPAIPAVLSPLRDYEADGKYSFVAKTNSWSTSWVSRNGDQGTESTTDTGAKIVWTGSEFDSSGHKVLDRDTWTFSSSTQFDDFFEQKATKSWETIGNFTCRKS